MKTTKLVLLFLLSIFIISPVIAQKKIIKNTVKQKLTLIELGSETCVPCQKMQPILKSISTRYNNTVKVIFYDVRKPDQEQFRQMYNVQLIPTQVFLDENGKEFFRHEGFYPELEIDKVLKTKGVKPLKQN